MLTISTEPEERYKTPKSVLTLLNVQLYILILFPYTFKTEELLFCENIMLLNSTLSALQINALLVKITLPKPVMDTSLFIVI